MRLFKILAFTLASLILFPQAWATGEGGGQQSLERVWGRYVSKTETARPQNSTAFPGRVVGDSPALRAFAAKSDWAGREVSYELYFASAPELARGIYGLALDSGDVAPDMALDRFERGAQGFHYSIAQVCQWANRALRGQMAWQTSEEREFLDRLLLDGAVNLENGIVVPGRRIRHILGAAEGTKRGFAANLAHERLHVLWDEDSSFKIDAFARWQDLSRAEKEEVYASLPGYSQEKEDLIIEEWAVRRAEKMPPEQREKLVGI